MGPRHLAKRVTYLSLASLLLTGCGLLGGGVPSQPASATNSPIPATAPQALVPSETADPTALPSEAPPPLSTGEMLTYLAQDGGFSIQYPARDELFVGARPSVDGVLAPLPDSITIVHLGPPNFQLTIEYSALEEGSSFADFIAADECDMGDAIGKELLVAGETSLLYADTPCGPYGSSRIFLTHGRRGYRFTVETHEAYESVRGPVLDLLSTVRWLPASLSEAPTSAAGPTPIPSPTPGPAIYVRDMDLITAQDGWAVVNGRLLWTSNAGQSWADITPEFPPNYLLEDVDFIDATHGWVVSLLVDTAGEATNAAIAHTADQGASWKVDILESIEPSLIAQLSVDFVDNEHGWVVARIMSGSNFNFGDLIRTRDGGQTWDRVVVPSGNPVHFASPDLGWTVKGPADNQLFVTRDGGSSWENVDVVPPDIVSGYVIYYTPTFVNAREGIVPIVLNDLPQTVVQFHRTSNGGLSWGLVESVPLDRELRPGTGFALSVIDSEHWILDAPDSFPNPPWPINAMEFSSPSVGWIYSSNSWCDKSKQPAECFTLTRFLRTEDGGVTWSDINVPQP